MSRAQDLVSTLDLQLHPEGGWYREIHRATANVSPSDGRPDRSALTVIYFLLERGQFSAWHVVASDECWQYCEGDPLELLMFDAATGQRTSVEVGPVTADRRSTSVVPPGVWQAAASKGEYTLVQCAVGPGFDFADFAMLRDSAERKQMESRLADWTKYV
ncbi:MAG TPA: cupin domain-containing protein [Caulifigura sp.]|jgi:predicted cupin superfamily sugar epimerase|nr:cupin domain-containing protein [Caulifigura sp.]